MKMTPPYLEEDYDDSDETATPEVPGIDDCDFLYSLCSRSGNSSVYIRVKETSSGTYHAAMTVDVDAPEGDNYVDSLPAEEGPFKLPEHACAANLEYAREWFRDNRLAYVYCSNTRKVARKYHAGHVACIIGESANPNIPNQ